MCPLREHETLLTPQRSQFDPASLTSLPSPSGEGDETYMMQTAWIAAIQEDEDEFLRAADALVQAGGAGESRYPAMLMLDSADPGRTDVVRHYLRDHFPIEDKPIFTIHVWAVGFEIATSARVTAMQQHQSYTASLLNDWADWVEKMPLWLFAVDPQPSPVHLRLMPIDMVMLSQVQKLDGSKVYLVDILYLGMPKRVAVLYQHGDTVLHLLRKAGLAEACDGRRHVCLFKEQGLASRIWLLHERVDMPHGSCFVIEFVLQDRLSCNADSVSLMQLPRDGQVGASSLGAYMRGWYTRHGEITVWVHFHSEQRLQLHAARFDVDVVAVQEQVGERCGFCCEDFTYVAVDPPPVLLVLPRPHVLVLPAGSDNEIPVLCQSFLNGRANLQSVLVDGRYPPVGVAVLFELVFPEQDCLGRYYCYVLYQGRRFLHHHDIELWPGSLLRLYAWFRDDDACSTDCGPLSDSQELSEAESLFFLHHGMKIEMLPLCCFRCGVAGGLLLPTHL